jgi:hypothetical protein
MTDDSLVRLQTEGVHSLTDAEECPRVKVPKGSILSLLVPRWQGAIPWHLPRARFLFFPEKDFQAPPDAERTTVCMFVSLRILEP